MSPGEIHGLHARIVDDLKAQLAAKKDAVSYWSGLYQEKAAECEQQRTRAESAEQELREYTELVFRERKAWEGNPSPSAEQELRDERERCNSGDWVEKSHAETLDKACKELEAKLDVAREDARNERTRADAAEQELRDLQARYDAAQRTINAFDRATTKIAAREALEP